MMASPQSRMLPVAGQLYHWISMYFSPRTQIRQTSSIAQRYSCQFATTEARSTSIWRVIEDLPDEGLVVNASSLRAGVNGFWVTANYVTYVANRQGRISTEVLVSSNCQ